MPSNFRSVLSASVGNTDTTIYTPTTAGVQATVIGLVLANVTSAQVTASVKVVKDSTTAFLVKDAPIPAGGSLVVVGGEQKLVVEQGMSVAVAGSAANAVNAVMSVLEITP